LQFIEKEPSGGWRRIPAIAIDGLTKGNQDLLLPDGKDSELQEGQRTWETKDNWSRKRKRDSMPKQRQKERSQRVV